MYVYIFWRLKARPISFELYCRSYIFQVLKTAFSWVKITLAWVERNYKSEL